MRIISKKHGFTLGISQYQYRGPRYKVISPYGSEVHFSDLDTAKAYLSARLWDRKLHLMTLDDLDSETIDLEFSQDSEEAAHQAGIETMLNSVNV